MVLRNTIYLEKRCLQRNQVKSGARATHLESEKSKATAAPQHSKMPTADSLSEYDSPWKESLKVYFESFRILCFPAVHREIDWSKGYVSRDKELQKLLAESETGKRIVDKLMRARRGLTRIRSLPNSKRLWSISSAMLSC